MNKFKKIFNIPFIKKYPRAALALVLSLVIATTGGVYSFLASTDEKDNMFTMGNLSVSLYEDDWYDHDTGEVLDDTDPDTGIAGNGIPNFAELAVCGSKIHKHPYVENTGDNAAYIFMSVGIPTIDVADAVATEEQINEMVGSEYTVKVTGYAFQEGLDNMTEEEMWDAFSNGTDAFKTKRTNNTRVGIFEITDVDTAHWKMIETFNSVDNYNYIVYAYKELLPGQEQEGVEQDPDSVLPFYRTTPLFENIRMTGFSTSSYRAREGELSCTSNNPKNPAGVSPYRKLASIADAPNYLAYNMVDDVPVYEDIVLSDGAVLHIARAANGVLTAYIYFTDGNYLRSTVNTGADAGNDNSSVQKVSTVFSQSKEYKISDIVSGTQNSSVGSCPHIELFCIDTRFYGVTIRLTFNVLGINGREYSFSAQNGSLVSNNKFYEPGLGSEGQAKWISACISTGMLIGDFAFAPGF